jgi:hypothetical protein
MLNFALSVVLLFGTPITRYMYTVPYLIGLPVHLGHTRAAWRWGPRFTHTKIFKWTLPLWMFGFLTPQVVGFAGPIEHIPFGSFVIYLSVSLLWAVTR